MTQQWPKTQETQQEQRCVLRWITQYLPMAHLGQIEIILFLFLGFCATPFLNFSKYRETLTQ